MMSTSFSSAALPPLTFRTLPLEVRLAIYEYLPSGPLAIRRPVSKVLPHAQNIESDSSIAILHTCRQIRKEAIPIFYRSVFIGSTDTLYGSHLPALSAMGKASVKKTFCDISTNPILFRAWLNLGNPFPNLQHCKLFVEKDLPFLNPSAEGKSVILGQQLYRFQRAFFYTPRPLTEMRVDLTIYLAWVVVPAVNPPDGCLRQNATNTERHYEVSGQSKLL
jgi:hypothetical protein